VAVSGKMRDGSGSVALVDAPVPPHSIEAEQAVLGGLMIDVSAWDNVADAVVA
jgi:replicative DNA helicase